MPTGYIQNRSVIGGQMKVTYSESQAPILTQFYGNKFVPEAKPEEKQPAAAPELQKKKESAAVQRGIVMDAFGSAVPQGVKPLPQTALVGRFLPYADSAYFNYQNDDVSGITIQEPGRPEAGEIGRTTFIPAAELKAEREKYYAAKAQEIDWISSHPYGQSTVSGEYSAFEAPVSTKSQNILTGSPLAMPPTPYTKTEMIPIQEAGGKTFETRSDIEYGIKQALIQQNREALQAELEDPFIKYFPYAPEARTKYRANLERYYTETPASVLAADYYKRQAAERKWALPLAAVQLLSIPFMAAGGTTGIRPAVYRPQNMKGVLDVGIKGRPIGAPSIPEVTKNQLEIGAYAAAEADLMQLGRAVADTPTRPYTLRKPASSETVETLTLIPGTGRSRVVTSETKITYVKPPKGFETQAAPPGAEIPFNEQITTEIVSKSGEYGKTTKNIVGTQKEASSMDLLPSVKTPRDDVRINQQVEPIPAFGARTVAESGAQPFAQSPAIKEGRLTNIEAVQEPVFDKATGTWRIRLRTSAANKPIDVSSPLSVVGQVGGGGAVMTQDPAAMVRITKRTMMENTDLINAIAKAKKPMAQKQAVGMGKKTPLVFTAPEEPPKPMTYARDTDPFNPMERADNKIQYQRMLERQDEQAVTRYADLTRFRYDRPISWNEAVSVKAKPAAMKEGGVAYFQPYQYITRGVNAAGYSPVSAIIQLNLERQKTAVESQTREGYARIIKQKNDQFQSLEVQSRVTTIQKQPQKQAQIVTYKPATWQFSLLTQGFDRIGTPGGQPPDEPVPKTPNERITEEPIPKLAFGIAAFGLPSGGSGSGKGGGLWLGGRRGTRYTPSVWGILSGAKSLKGQGLFTGLEVRGIPRIRNVFKSARKRR